MRPLLVLLLAAGYEEPDTLSPSYRPRAPVRAAVGKGHVLTGADGGYRFQSDPPEHIRTLVSAEGSSRWPATATTPRAGPAAASTACSRRRGPDGWRVVAALG
jgi:hypothetical protein